ncbi:hypothetical protein GCM10027418_06780 [Mariniluteicoccus endophyticus]
MNREPALTTGTVTALVAAVVVLLIACGVPITEEQKLAILGVIAAASPVVGAVLTRPQVTPNAAVVERVDADGLVRAGEGSELETGTTIREAGSLDADIGGWDGVEDTPRRAAGE